MDPFFDEPTLILTCDVIEPSDGKGYDRDPRSIAKRAEAYLKSTGIGDTAYFGPEPEFFIFDSVTWHDNMSGCGVKINSEEAAWSSGREVRERQHRPPSQRQGRLLPRAPGRQPAGHPCRHVLALEETGIPVEVHPPRSGDRRPVRNRHHVQHADQARRLDADPEVRGAERRPRLRQDRDLHAQAHRRRQRFRHARPPVDLERRQEPVRGQRLCRPVRNSPVLHRRHHQARQGAERDHQPRHQLLQASGARLRSAGDAGLLGPQPFRLDPHPASLPATRPAASRPASRIRPPTRTCASPH